MRLPAGLLSFLLLLGACGSGGETRGPPEPILGAGSVTLGGRSVAIAYGAAKAIGQRGTIAMAMSDVELDCSTFDRTRPPDHGTFVSIQVPSAEKGVAAQHLVDFSVFQDGDYAAGAGGGGSNEGTIEVLDATADRLSLRVAYRATIAGVEQAIQGDFTTKRCP